MPLVLSANKGRSGSQLLRLTLRESCAWSLATNSRFYCRWGPSERNTADGPSRGKMPGGLEWAVI
eukprot:1799896-Karenia_brevis.AAC.1